ncbi:hypothetical protein D5086_033098 [Populus alba]|uniref:Uncharacterized protein n=2 Tax=Populus alba TaxID=43335 RepID=A0ACC4AFU2_POPAL|nr:hypothetical protein D5086_0000118640 [Populus alba]
MQQKRWQLRNILSSISSAACIKEVVGSWLFIFLVLSNVEPACYESNSSCSSKMMRAGQKQFSIDLGSNKRGHFLEITNDSYSREGHLTDENLKKRFSAKISETQVLNADEEACITGELI